MAHGGYGKRRVKPAGRRSKSLAADKKPKAVSLKNQIRSVERMLRKNLPAEVREAQEQKLEGLRKQQEIHSRLAVERKIFLRDRKIKFFERRKIERRIRRLEKLQRASSGQAQDAETAEQLSKLKEDLEYVRFFPKTEKYVSLFTGGDDSEMVDKRNRLREQIKANLVAAAAGGKDLEEPMADKRGTKRLSEEERRERLAKMANLGKGEAKVGTSAPPSQGAAPPAVPATRAVPATVAPVPATVAPPAPPTSRPSARPRDDRQPARSEARPSHSREDRSAVPPLSSRGTRGESRPSSSQESSAHRALVTKFEERLSAEVAESSKRSDPVKAIDDGVNKQIEALCLMLSGYAAAKGFANRMADEVKAADANARHARRAEKDANTARSAAEEARKKAEDRAKAAEDRAKEAEDRQRFAEDWAQKTEQAAEEAETSRAELEGALRKAQQELASARAEHEKYIRVALPAVLEEARAQAVANFLESEDFNTHIVHMYQEGMRDMKAGFTAANPGLVGVDWSFVPAESEETMAEEVPEEGEVTGAARELGDLIVLDDQVPGPEQPAMPEPKATPAEPQQPAGQEQPEPQAAPAEPQQPAAPAGQEQPEPPTA